MSYKMIALDIDGTLKNSQNQITPRTKEVLMKAQEKGIIIVLASGRPTAGLKHEYEELQLHKYENYLITYNGACVMNANTKEIIYDNKLSIEQVKRIYDHTRKHRLSCLTYRKNEVISEDSQNPYIQKEKFFTGLDIHQVDSLKENLIDPIYKVLCAGDPDYVETILDDFQKPFQKELSIYRSLPYFVEVMAKNVDKAKSLRILSEYLHIDPQDIIAFGDGYNDKGMLMFAGKGIAMGNAVDELKKCADEVTLSHDEDGIAYALSQLL